MATIITAMMSPDIAALVTGNTEVVEQTRKVNLPKRDGRRVVHVDFQGPFIERLVMETMANVG